MHLSRTTTAPLLGLAAAAVLFVAPQSARAQGLILNSGDAVTVSGAGTVGTVGGQPVSNNTTAYSGSMAVKTNGTSTFTLGSGGTLTSGKNSLGLYSVGSGLITITGGILSAGDNGYGLYAGGTGPVTISGGTFTTGNNGFGLYAGGTGPVTITGGTFTVGSQGSALFCTNSGSIDLYGSFSGLTAGQTQALPGTGYSGSFNGTLANNTASQTISYTNRGTITLHNIAPAAAPEPSQFAALAIGLLGLGALALKARKRQAA